MFETARIISRGNGESRHFDPLHEVGKRIEEARWLHDKAIYAMETADWNGLTRKLAALREVLEEARELHEKAVGQ